MRSRFLLAALLLAPLAALGQTAKTKAALYTQIDTQLPSNSSGAITAATLRAVFKDTIASAYNPATDGTLFDGTWASLSGKPTLFDGTWASLTGKPTLFSGSYTDLTNRPTLFSGAYADLTGLPSLFSGSAADLTGTLAVARLSANVPLLSASNTFTGATQTAPAWLLPVSNTPDTITPSQSGIGWADSGRFTVQTPVGALQFYNTGSPSVPTFYWPGKIVSNSTEAVSITGTISANLITTGTIPQQVMRDSQQAVLNEWQGLYGYASANGIPYVVDSDSIAASGYEPTPGTYYPQAVATTVSLGENTIKGRYRTAAQMKTDLAIAAADVSGLAASATTDATNASNISTGTLNTARLPDTLRPTAELQLPTNAPGTPTAGDLYRVADTLRYRDSTNTERLILNATDNLANLSNTATARTNLGLATVAASGSAADLTTGTLPDARFPATLPAASGANLTALNASNLASGTLAAARLPSNVVVTGRQVINKADTTISATTVYAAQTGTFTPGTDAPGPRIITLPDATVVPAGMIITITDESYTLRPWYSLRITPSGTQTINGFNTPLTDMVWPGQTVRLVSSGAGGWSTVSSWPLPNNALLVSQGGRRDYIAFEDDLYYGWSTTGSSALGSSATFLRTAGSATGFSGARVGQWSRGILQSYLGAAALTTYATIAIGGNDSGGIATGAIGTTWAEWRLRPNTIDAANTSGIQVGIGNGWSSDYQTDLTDGVYWQATNASTAVWRMKTAASSTRTDNASSIAYAAPGVADEWVHLAVEWDAAGAKGHFFYGAVSASNVMTWTYAGTNTTNVPGTSRNGQAMFRRGWLTGTANGGGDVAIDRVRYCIIPTISSGRAN